MNAPMRLAGEEPGQMVSDDPVRVMVVDDSAVIRGLISRWINEDPNLTVVSSVSNGELAIKAIGREDIEVAILDIEMPVMDGMTALPLLLEASPGLQVIMASTLTLRNADISIQAMSIGAADYLPKPESTREVNASEDFRRDLIAKVFTLGESSRRKTGKSSPSASSVRPEKAPALALAPTSEIVLRAPSPVVPTALAVGSSTGGPQALIKFFTSLADQPNVPIFVTQHMPATFTKLLAAHIAKATGWPCAEAVDGERAEAGHIYLAPGDFHMTLEQGHVLRLDQGPQVNFCRPSVDPMLESLCKIYKSGVLTVILTGMGQDGLEGARLVTQAGGTVIAQDEETSVVWGMPGAVASDGLCSAVLPLDVLGGAVDRVMGGLSL